MEIQHLSAGTLRKCSECGCILFQTRMQMKLPPDRGNDLICVECDIRIHGKNASDEWEEQYW